MAALDLDKNAALCPSITIQGQPPFLRNLLYQKTMGVGLLYSQVHVKLNVEARSTPSVESWLT